MPFMNFMKFLIVSLAFISQTIAWAARWDDSVTARGHSITTPVPPQPPGSPDFFQSGFIGAKGGFNNASDVEALCNTAYQNRTGVPITVTIIPGGTKDRVAYLFVKQTPTAGWVTMAYSQNSIPTSVQIPDKAVYCPTMNENGVFYVTVLKGDLRVAEQFAVEYRFWSDESLQPGLSVSDPEYGCLNVVAIRTTYINGNTPSTRLYMIRPHPWAITGLIPIRTPLLQGTCPAPPDPSLER